MLRLVPANGHPGRSALELASALETRGYQVTQRTVERDLEICSVHAARNRRQGSSSPLAMAEDPEPRVPGMEAAEAMALFIMRDAIKTHLPVCFRETIQSRFAEADKVLRALAQTGSRIRWSDRVRVVPSHQILRPPQVPTRIIQTLQTALLRDVALDVTYTSLSDDGPRRRTLFPRALLLRGSAVYLIAHQKGGGAAPHHYAVQRFTSARLLEFEPWPTKPFSLDEFMAAGTNQFGTGRDIRLKAIVSESLFRILRDTPLSDDMKIDTRGREKVLTATVRDTWALHSWILGHGENIRVLLPLALRRESSRRAQAAAAQYD